MRNVLKVDSADGCITWRIYIMGLNCTLKNGKFYFVNISPWQKEVFKKKKKNKHHCWEKMDWREATVLSQKLACRGRLVLTRRAKWSWETTGAERKEKSCLMASPSHAAQLCFLQYIPARFSHTLSVNYIILELDWVDLRPLQGNHPWSRQGTQLRCSLETQSLRPLDSKARLPPAPGEQSSWLFPPPSVSGTMPAPWWQAAFDPQLLN